MQETWVQSLGWEDPQEKKMAAHSSMLAWRIPWTEEPGRQHFMGSQRVGYDWAHTHTHTPYGLWTAMESHAGKHVFMNAAVAYLLCFSTAWKEIHFQNVCSSKSLGRSHSMHLLQEKQKCFLQEMMMKLRIQCILCFRQKSPGTVLMPKGTTGLVKREIISLTEKCRKVCEYT